MQSKSKSGTRYMIQLAIMASLVGAIGTSAAVFAAPTDNEAVFTAPPVSAAEAQAQESWRADMARHGAPAEGCYSASYPSILWKKATCVAAPAKYRSKVPSRSGSVFGDSTHTKSQAAGRAQTVGNGEDYVVQGPGLLSGTVGSFPTVSGVTSETGTDGSNDYTLQLNTNFNGTTSTCKSYSYCTVWQQFIYESDVSSGYVFIQYWLFSYGSSTRSGGTCPSGWNDAGADPDGIGEDCYVNSSAISAPAVAASQLANVKLSGSVVSGGNDTTVFTNGTTAYTLTTKDSKVNIAAVWNQSEFNIVGDGGGSAATFNTGSTITVKDAVTDGSTSAPTCVGPSDAGFTGETNNLTLTGSCTATGASSPYIQFTESN